MVTQQADPPAGGLGSTFQEIASSIYRFIYAKVGNREAAEDLTRQVFLRATPSLSRDSRADGLHSWLYTTARSMIVAYWHQQSGHAGVPDAALRAVLFCGDEGPAEVQRTRERARRLLDTLPEPEREVLRLRFLNGYTAEEIGYVLDLPPDTVRVLQLQALRRASASEVQQHGALPDTEHAG